MKRIDAGQIVRPKFREVCIDGKTTRVERGSLNIGGAGRVEDQLSNDHRVLWVHIDGHAVLRVTPISGGITGDDHRLRWEASDETYRCNGVLRGDPPPLKGAASRAAPGGVLAELEAQFAALGDECS